MSKSKLAVTAEMLIRKPIDVVYSAWIDPAITTKFWFTKSSAKLSEVGQTVTWQWEMYNASAKVVVKALEPNKRILIEWGAEGAMTTVEWIFTPYKETMTFVQIKNTGFAGSDDEIVAKALDSKGGFSFALASSKAWLEHGIQLKLVEDHAPPGVHRQGGC